jgi:2-polyprenyl-3-methyl-5-hydroxy-6-metoxy-1,4-benzoquinol methylase
MTAPPKRICFADVDGVRDDSLVVAYLDQARSMAALKQVETHVVELLSAAHATSVLEVGCGCGDLLACLARLGLQCLGVDKSVGLVAEARRRHADTAGLNFMVHDFSTGDGRARIEPLGVEPGSLDGLILNRVLQHIADPMPMLRNALEWLRPGALIVLSDADWGSLQIDHPDQKLARQIIVEHCRAMINPKAGASLQSMLSELGLGPVRELPKILNLVTDFETAVDMFSVRRALLRLVERQELTSAVGERWLGQCEEQAAAGMFRARLTHHIACATR